MAGGEVRRWLAQRRSEIEKEITHLRLKKDVIDEMIEDLGEGGAAAGIEKRVSTDLGRGLSPSEAVDEVLRKHPGEFTRQQVADLLEDRVDSSADSPRNVVFTALRRKEDEGKIMRTEDDKLVPVLSGPEDDGEPLTVEAALEALERID